MRRTLFTGVSLTVAVVAMAIVVGTSVADDDSKRSKDTVLGEAWAAGWNSHDPDRVVEDYTRDVLYEDLALGVVLNGREELRAFAASVFLAVPDAHFEILPDETFARGEVAHVGWLFSGTDVGIFGTGQRFSVRGSSPLRLARPFGGHRHHGRLQIERAADYYDLATIMRQVGVLSSP